MCFFLLIAFRESLPDFFEKVKSKVRTPEQGADTAVWLALSENIPLEHNGCFFEGEFWADKRDGSICGGHFFSFFFPAIRSQTCA